jgi:fatty-acyl-CoA synthase
VLPGPSFDAAEVLAAVERERCTSLVGVPAMFLALLEHPERAGRDLSSLRTGLMAGAPCPPELVRRARAELHVPELAVAYGMTETSPATAQTTLDDGEEARSTTVGRAHPHVELKVVDAGGTTVRRGREGELCARGYPLMRGYWGEPERTADVVDGHGWLHTGDLATMDESGYVRITGRIKDVIIRGGENVSSREVEQLLVAHPDIDEACVIGVPDPALGEQAMAWVRLRPGASLTADEVRLHCLRRVASFKVPRYIRIVDQLLVSGDGTFAKRRLQEQAIEELGLSDLSAFVGAYR